MNLIFCPLKFELKALLKALDLKVQREGEVYRGNHSIIALGAHGKVQYALKAYEALQKFKPQNFICVGAAGGLTSGVKPLDVIAGTKTIEHDYNLKFIEKPLPEFSGDELLIEKLGSAKKGIIASGDEDIMTPERALEIHNLTGALAVAWEGAGGARAARMNNVSFLELRVITDMCGSAAASDFEANMDAGMALVAKHLLEANLI